MVETLLFLVILSLTENRSKKQFDPIASNEKYSGEKTREKRVIRILNWTAVSTHKPRDFYGRRMNNENNDGHAKVWSRISSNQILMSELCRHVRDGSSMIGGHSTSPSARPCHGVVSADKKKTNYIMNELVKISLFGCFCDIRNWFTCAFAHVTFTCRLLTTAHTTFVIDVPCHSKWSILEKHKKCVSVIGSNAMSNPIAKIKIETHVPHQH